SEVEADLIGRLAELGVAVRWGHRLTGLRQDADGAELTFATDGGAVVESADWVVGADGAHSAVRHALGVGFPGHTFEDRFLIADVRVLLGFPNERRFFFDPPSNPGRQVLIHPQPDGVWRIDWQVSPATDADQERRNGGLDRRIRAVVGRDTDYSLVWVTGYRFSQRLADRFRIDRVFLAGDAAHLMSPFGARGLNSGVADAENLAWKLALVAHCQVRGDAVERLLDSYEAERRPAAVENLAVTEATMRFMVPHDAWRRAWRNLVLRMSPRSAWFRARVNSGRLSEPAKYSGSPLVEPAAPGERPPTHGAVAPDVPLTLTAPGDGGRTISRLRRLIGEGFVVLGVGLDEDAARRLGEIAFPVPCRVVADRTAAGTVGAIDHTGRLAETYGAHGPRAWVIRPDGHVAGSVPLDRGVPAATVAARVSAAAGMPGRGSAPAGDVRLA
ncbi:MAG TPA: FAD-dependent monooxygenase, partial [Candidatus Limnocylindria bacterium]|nr:FAD-dependent monooxygenase [Candidatus Limnocylindria bacterium]